MTDKEVPSWLKYEEEKQVSVSQVRLQFSDLSTMRTSRQLLLYCGMLATVSILNLHGCREKTCKRSKRPRVKVASARQLRTRKTKSPIAVI